MAGEFTPFEDSPPLKKNCLESTAENLSGGSVECNETRVVDSGSIEDSVPSVADVDERVEGGENSVEDDEIFEISEINYVDDCGDDIGGDIVDVDNDTRSNGGINAVVNGGGDNESVATEGAAVSNSKRGRKQKQTRNKPATKKTIKETRKNVTRKPKQTNKPKGK